MNFKPSNSITIFTVFLIFTSCERPTAQRFTTAESANSSTISQAPQFERQNYVSLDGAQQLTLISAEECELKNTDGIILLCKYSKEPDKLRIVTTTLGTPRVNYFILSADGVKDPTGTILYHSTRRTAALAEQERRQREREARIQTLTLESQKETKMVYSTTQLSPSGFIRISDIGFEYRILHKTGEVHAKTVWFGELANWMYDDVQDVFVVSLKDYAKQRIRFQSSQAGKQTATAFNEALADWREKYEEIVPK